jgi:Tfp pilus assembly protein PilF
MELLRQQMFEALEEELHNLQATFAEGKCAECAANAPYVDFATSDPLVGQRIDEWVKARPDSVPAHLARGRYLNHIAWLARGAGFASETRPEQFAEMAQLQTAAVKDLLWVVQHEPKSPLAYADLIYIATAQRGEVAAAQIYDDALQANPDSPAIYRARVWSLSPWWQGVLPWRQAMASQKQYIVELQQKYEGKPGFEWLKGYDDYMEAEAHWRNGDMDAAVSSYGRALSSSERAVYLLARAHAFEHLRKLDLADADRKRAMELDPSDGDAQFENGKLNSWRCQTAGAGVDSSAQCNEATAELDAAVASDPLDPKFLLYRASHLANIGRTDDARRDIENAEVYGKYDLWARDMIAAVLAIFDKPAAKLAFQKMIALSPDDPTSFEGYLAFLKDTGDCDFLAVQADYRKLCGQNGQCRLIRDLDGMIEEFQQSRRQTCANKSWSEPASAMAMPE